MSTAVTWNGTGYTVPAGGEVGWSALASFLIDLGTNAGVTNVVKQAVRKATTTPVTVSNTTDYGVVTDLAVAGAVAVNLPAGSAGRIFVIVDGKGDASTNNITITRNGSDTIAGATTLVLNSNRQAVALQYNSTDTDWKILYNQAGSVSLNAVGSSPNANGATVSGNSLTLQPASASQPGVLTTGAQTIAGAKTFSSAVVVGGNTTGDSNLGTIASVSLAAYYTGSFTSTFDGAGFASAQSVTVLYTKIGRLVTLEFPSKSATGAGSGSAFIATTATIPTSLVPQGTIVMPANVSDGGDKAGQIYINTSGIVRFYRAVDESTTFTNSGTIGWERTSISFIAAS